MADTKDSVSRIAEEVGKVAAFIGMKAGEAADNAKVALAINYYQTVADKLYKKLGNYYYNQYKNGQPINDELAEDLKQIDSALAAIETLQAKED